MLTVSPIVILPLPRGVAFQPKSGPGTRRSADMVTLDGKTDGIRGRALMVHANSDDYRSQPSGDAGERLSCGVIQ